MVPLGIFLVPLVLGAGGDLTNDGYVVDNKTASLISAPSTERSSNDWNILELDKRRIDKSVFDSVSGIKVLNLADNFLDVLSQSILSNLRNRDGRCPTGDGTAVNSARTYADVWNLQSPEVTDNTFASLRAGRFDRQGVSIDHAIPKTTNSLLTYYNRPSGIELVYLFHQIAPLDRLFNFRVSLPGSVRII